MIICMTAALAVAGQEAVRLAEPYTAPYAGDDATGPRVLGYWTFDGDQPLADASGKGHDLTLNGAVLSPEGKFGGSLVSGRGWPDADVAHQAKAKNSPSLTPAGAFTIELWLAADAALEGYPEAFLLDKKYVSDNDYQWTLSAAGSDGRRRLQMRLGFGTESDTWLAEPRLFEPGVWHHVAFTYDGAGDGRFWVDGRGAGGELKPARGRIVGGKHDLVIGDRVGSLYHGFPGKLDNVRLSNGVLEFRAAGFALTSLRRTFVRMEPDAALTFSLTNRQRTPLTGAKVSFAIEPGLGARSFTIDALGAGESRELSYPFDTNLRPGNYRVAATVDLPGEPPVRSTETFEVTLVGRTPPRMPVVMWGGTLNDLDRTADLGFTHTIGLPCDYDGIWKAGEPTAAASPEQVATAYASLDAALAKGVQVVASLSPGRWARKLEEYRRLGPDGKPVKGQEDVTASLPAIQEFCYNVGASMARTFGSHPAWDAALEHTEVRGESNLSYRPEERAAFKAFAGYDIPEGLASMRGTDYTTIDGFPADRVIADDDPRYVFYRWWWREGDGWNGLQTQLDRGLKSTGRKDLWTFHDPAVRVASAWGSGGQVDYLSQWTYSYPEPIRIGLATDELFAMAAGDPERDQRVMKMTQIIWYRSQTAPEPGEEAKQQSAEFSDQDTKPAGTGAVDASGRYQAAWEREIPDARFITIAPMHLREAFWTKLSRPIQGIMYHGWGSLVDDGGHGSYRYTHPETRHELRRLVEEVIRPLGPTLQQVPDRPADVAYLESFASQMFAKRGTYGWNGGWGGDGYLILQYAGLQTAVVYDETVQRDGLGQYKVVVAFDCDVLPRSVVDKLKAFQAAGGILVGDDHLCPALQPDIVVPTIKRPKEADQAKARLLESAAALRKELDPHYQRYYGADQPEVITRARQYKSSDYLFAVNDRREFGDYVGHHKLVQENGLPLDGNLYVHRAAGHVYDLLQHREVAAEAANGLLKLPQSFGPCEGRLFLVTDRPIADLRVTVPEQAQPGAKLTVGVAVVDDGGRPVEAIVPVQVELLDPDGRAAEYSGYWAAVDGQLSITADLAPNDARGLWRVRVTELASGMARSGYVRVGG